MISMKPIFGTDAPSASTAAKNSYQLWIVGSKQLAKYDHERYVKSGEYPTGKVISSLEALNTYGLPILDEATEYGSAILKEKVQ